MRGDVGRREFLGMLGAAGVLAACSSSKSSHRSGAPTSATVARSVLPRPADAPFDTIVVVMMENRSFDHLLGWVPGADGRQAGLTYADTARALHPTSRLVDFQGCAHPDPDHSYEGGRVEYDGGQCDGWLNAGQNDEYAIGYY